MKNTLPALISVIAALAFIPDHAQANSGDFAGGVAIGSGYAGVNTAPTNGLIIQGNVGIGTNAPTAGTALDLGYNSNAMLLPVGTTGQRPATAANGEIRYNSTLASLESYINGAWQTLFASATTPIFSSGQLQYDTTTEVQYCPYKGNMKTLAGTAGVYTIPSACLTSTITSAYLNGTSGQSLSSSTLYYAYLYNASGTEVIDWSTTGHATDSTNGVEEKSGDATRTLIGMIYVNGSGHISASNTQGAAAWTVATWDNRRPTTCSNYFSANRSTTTSAPGVEINSEIRCTFMSWGDSAVIASSEEAYNNTAGQDVVMDITIDGTSTLVGQNYFQTYAANAIGGTPVAASYTPSEGEHYVTITGSIGGGTGTATFYGGTNWPLTVNVSM